jgi:hypothetical protein
MKPSLLLLFALACCVLAANHANSTPKTQPASCKRNSIIKRLQTKGAVFLAKPQTGVRKCGKEWREHGTCCEVNSLIAVAKNDTSEIHSAAERVSNFISYYFEFFDQAFDRAAALSNATEALAPAKRKLVEFLMERRNSSFKQLVDEVVDRNSTLQKFKDCWAFIAMKRSNSLCSICSGGASRFLYGSKIIIRPNLCKNTMKKCDSSLLMVVRLFRSMGSFAEALTEIFRNWPHLLRQIENFRVISNQMKKYHVLTILNNYFFSTNPKVKRYDLKAMACKNFLSIVRTTFVERLNTVLRFKKEFFGILKDFLNQHEKLVDAPHNQSETPLKLPAAHAENASANHSQLLGQGPGTDTNRLLLESGTVSNFSPEQQSEDQLDELAQKAAKKLLATDVFVPPISFSNINAISNIALSNFLDGKETLISDFPFP